MNNPLKVFILGLFFAVFCSLVFILVLSFKVSPVVSDVSFSKVSESSVRVVFKTSSPVIAKLEYGTSEMYGVESSQGPLASAHEFVISGLLPNRTHYFRVAMLEDSKMHFSGNYIIPSF